VFSAREMRGVLVLVLFVVVLARGSYVQLYASFDRATALCVGQVLLSQFVASGACTQVPMGKFYVQLNDTDPSPNSVTSQSFSDANCTVPIADSLFTVLYGFNIPMFTGTCAVIARFSPPGACGTCCSPSSAAAECIGNCNSVACTQKCASGYLQGIVTVCGVSACLEAAVGEFQTCSRSCSATDVQCGKNCAINVVSRVPMCYSTDGKKQ
jgi:hypothetical protein